MRYRLVVADVDGTLVQRGGDLPEAVARAVAAFRARGGRFTLATGRPTPAVRHYAEALGLDVPAIVFNGAQVVDFRTSRVLHQQTVALETARRALELAEAAPVDAFLYLRGEILVREITPAVEGYMRKDRIAARPVGDLRAALTAAPPKLLFIGPVAASVAVMEQLRAEGYPGVNYVQSDADYIELLPAGASKGAALEWLAGHLGVPLDRVAAVGDQMNDLDMLRRAGLGVAVANAAPELKRHADLVTGAAFGEGVAEVLGHLVSGVDAPSVEAPYPPTFAVGDGT